MAISSPTSRRIEPAEFSAIVAPCLTLVAPSGMSREDRRAWAHAAHAAIGDVDPAMLKRAAAEAMKTADHPSKIVPAITRFIEAERREDDIRRRNSITPIPVVREKIAPIPHEETQAILRKAGLSLADTPDPSKPAEMRCGTGNPGKMPTYEDYIRMGVDPAVLDAA